MIRYDLTHLIELYKVAVDEYRFNVNLSWDRAKYYLVFNSAIVSVATGLLSLRGSGTFQLLVGLIFVVGFFTCLIGASAVRTAHEYYRRAVFKKTVLEDVLGLGSKLGAYPYADATLAVGTTRGQAERTKILQQTEEWLASGLRPGSVVYWVRMMLYFLAIVDLLGAGLAVTLWFTGTNSSPEL